MTEERIWDLEITVRLLDHPSRRDWADCLRDIADKLEKGHKFTREDRWYDMDGYTLASYHEENPDKGSIYGLE